MKDITSTSFGIIIAFVLPGLAFLLALAPWSVSITNMFVDFSKAPSTVGLFFIVVLIAIGIALLISGLRWLIFELILQKIWKMDPAGFRQLGDEPRLTAFRAAVDELYRYHQFYGGMALVLPFFYCSYHDLLLCKNWPEWCVSGVAIILEIVTISNAVNSYYRFTKRAKPILE